MINAEVEWLLALKLRLQSGLHHRLSAAIVSHEFEMNQPTFPGSLLDANTEVNLEDMDNVFDSESSEELEKEAKNNEEAGQGNKINTTSELVMKRESVMASESVALESIILEEPVVAEKAVNRDDAAVTEPTANGLLDESNFLHEETQRRHSIFLPEPELGDQEYHARIYEDGFEQSSNQTTKIGPQRTAKISLDLDVHDKLGVSPVSHLTKKSCYDTEVLFLNVLAHEVGQVLLGPVKENLDIFSRRCSYKSFWRKHVESLKPRYPEKYVCRKVRELLRFLHDDEHVNLPKQAMINLGITMVSFDDFPKKKHGTVDEATKESSSRNVPVYLIEEDDERRKSKDLTHTSSLHTNKNLESW